MFTMYAFSENRKLNYYMVKMLSFRLLSVAYAESFRRGPKFRHNRVTSQINLGSAEGTTIIGWSGGMPRKNFAKLHQKYAFLYQSNRKVLENQKSVRICLKSRANTEYSRKTSFGFAKTALFWFTVFHF